MLLKAAVTLYMYGVQTCKFKTIQMSSFIYNIILSLSFHIFYSMITLEFHPQTDELE